MSSTPLSSLALHFEYDLVAARRRARQIAAALGFDDQDQTRIAAVASEIARNALHHGGGGRLVFGVERLDGVQSLTMTVTDRGAGGEARTEPGIGSARRLMDALEIHSGPGKGTTVVMKKSLRPTAPVLNSQGIARVVDELSRQRPESPLAEIQQQNGELLQALVQLSEREEELSRLRKELDDTRRVVLAPQAESALPAKTTLRILVIDDDETARYAVAGFATRPGTEITEAENGLAGIARAQAERPDVILLDLMMPGIGGHEVLQRLKTDPATAHIPVIVITSRFVNAEERAQIMSRAVAVIYKGDLSRETVTRAIDVATAGT